MTSSEAWILKAPEETNLLDIQASASMKTLSDASRRIARDHVETSDQFPPSLLVKSS